MLQFMVKRIPQKNLSKVHMEIKTTQYHAFCWKLKAHRWFDMCRNLYEGLLLKSLNSHSFDV